MVELMEFMAIIVVLLSMISWPIIFIGKWIHRIRGKCPETRVCFDTKCVWHPWCKRFSTIGYNIAHVKWMLEEKQRIEKEKEKEKEREKEIIE